MADDRRREDARPGDPAEGVRIIGAEEAAEAIERGDVAPRRGTHLPRYGDRPARPPAGSPKPALRFPLDASADPAEAAPVRPAKGVRFDPRPAPAWDDTPVDDTGPDEEEPWPAEATWGETGSTDWGDGANQDVVAWTKGETGAVPVVDAPAEGEPAAPEAEGGLAWAEDFVDDDDPWDGSWDEPTGTVRWADDAPAAGEADAPETPGPAAGWAAPEGEVEGAEADAEDAWAAFSEGDEARAEEAPRGGLLRFGRRGGEGGADDADRDGEAADPIALTDEDGDADEDDEAEAWGPPEDDATVVSGPVDALDDEAAVADDGDRGPLFDPDGGWAEPEGKVFDFADEPSGQVELPHWTEPGTGELPRVLAGEGDTGGPTSGASPVWHAHDGGWGEEGFDDLADDDGLRVGALDDERPHHDELYSFDELDPEVEADDGLEPAIGGDRRMAPARPLPPPDRPTAGGAGRNLGVAVPVGLACAAVALLAFWLGSAVATVLVTVILVMGVIEYQKAVLRAGYRPAALLGIVAAAAYPLAVHWKGIEAYPLLGFLTLAAALAWHLAGADGDARVVESVGVTLLGVAWIGGLGSFAALLLALPDGTGLLIGAVIAAVAYDVGGLAVGRTMGATPLSDASPNKTVEGLVGGVLISLVMMLVVGLAGLAPFDAGSALKVGLLAVLAAPLGDLCQSLIKRDLGVKDMGSIIPEHGGVLDRFDSLLFVLPAVYYGTVAFHVGPFG